MDLNKFLSELDLTKKEVDTYLSCLKLGATTVNKISLETGIKRTTLYDILRNLQNKKLVNVATKGKKQLFYAEDPEKLSLLLEEKQQRLRNALPDLKAIYNQAGSRAKVKYYEGKRGLEDVYRDTLTCTGNISAFVTEDIFTYLGEDFGKEYLKKRIKNNIFVRAIGPDTQKVKDHKKNDQQEFRKTVLVPKKEFPFTIEMNIYNNKVAYMSFKDEIGVIIESSEISKNMKLLFELAWKGAKSK
jgi:HTH-type transcriptional regulator, sugar sensing transcriptional regulator